LIIQLSSICNVYTVYMHLSCFLQTHWVTF